jgi:large subunit ribosomal protein L5
MAATYTQPDASTRPRLRQRYDSELRAQLKETLGLANVMEVPNLEKIVLNMGVGRASAQASLLEGAVKDMTLIAGQKPIITKAKKSIAGFKLREGYAIGCKVTLRGDRKWEFLDRLISVAIPRMRDFRGMPTTGFDGRGKYTFGISDQLIFPELDYDKIDTLRGLNISITTTAKNDEECKALLAGFRFPFKN